jgi:hypothetical protein
MSEIQPILDDIRDELGTDIYYVYRDERHFLLESLAVAVATACLIEYVKGLLAPRELGERHRQHLKEFVQEVRGGDMISIKAEMDALDKEARALLKAAPSEITAEREKAAIENLQTALIQFGMPSTQAEVHSKSVAALVKTHLNM